MIVTRDTPEQLVLTHRPLALVAALMAAAGLLLWLAGYNFYLGNTGKALLSLLLALAVLGPSLWFGMERVQVTFDATAAGCRIEVLRLSGPTEEWLPLAEIDRAMLQTHKGQSDTR
ncbi:MAG: hypothetical protein PVI41_11920, partial [Roseobacter sp.]